MPDANTYAAEHGITLEVLDGPNQTTDAEGWEHFAYELRLAHFDRTMDVPWRAGLANTDSPTVGDVLDCIASDVSSIEQEPDVFEWMAEFGYLEGDADAARRGREAFEAIVAQRTALQELLHDADAYAELLYDLERL